MHYLLATLVLAPLSGFLWAFFLRQKHKPRVVHESIPGLSLRISHSSGLADTLTLPSGRISCGFSPDYDIDLAQYIKAGRNAGKAGIEELAFQLDAGRLAVTARSKVMMNGVERRSGSIPVNGSLLYKSCRFTFLGQAEIQKEQSVYPAVAALRKMAAVPAMASLATVVVLVLGLVNLGTSGYLMFPTPPSVILAEQPTEPSQVAGPEPVPVTVPEPATVPEPSPAIVQKPLTVPLRSAVRPEPVKPVPEGRTAPEAISPVRPPASRPLSPEAKVVFQVPERATPPRRPVSPEAKAVFQAPRQTAPLQQPLPGTEAVALMPSKERSRLKPDPEPEPKFAPYPAPYPAPLMVKPGEPVPDQRVDVLFIHAHPDDESLDYGALMALCSGAGLTSATVLLTDGEGGIYQQDYTGPRDNLVSTRIQEATRALQFLGGSIYIRLGLKNNPYNSLLEEKGVQEVLKLWDGDAVAVQLAGIINTLGPKVVVSPEGPSFAREHFEHETTGVLTLMALQHLQRTGGHLPEAHLVSVDPRQKDAYTGLVSFPRQGVMEKQRRALLAHATQADATYFGVQIIERYSEEYYLIQYWDSAIHFTHFFGLASASTDSVPGSDSPLVTSAEPYRQAP
jgi:LmbE family N-acetylglucosaminyl deacetylase